MPLPVVARYANSTCYVWYACFNVYYTVNSLQLYRLLLSKAKLTDSMRNHVKCSNIVWYLVHVVHVIASGSLAIVSVTSPVEYVIDGVTGGNVCVSRSPPWMWYEWS